MYFDNLSDWLQYLESLNIRRSQPMAFSVLRTMASRLGVSTSAVPIITVTGTNGKGSTVALLELIYSKAGYRVGTFTSPHLLYFNERIRVLQHNVDEQEIVKAFNKIAEVRGDLELIYFQYSFLAALLIYQYSNLDLIILEAGIGGKYDAVNIIDPDLSIITNVTFDHCDILGFTREEIAQEKAGIMRKGKVVVFGDYDMPLTIPQIADKMGARLYCLGQEFDYKVLIKVWTWFTENETLQQLPIPSIELNNAATILMVIHAFQQILPVSKEVIFQSLATIKLPGRQELIIESNKRILLDVAHNVAAVNLLAKKIERMNIEGKCYAVVGMLKDKDISGSLSLLVPYVHQWFVSSLSSSRSATKQELSQILEKLKASQVLVFDTIDEAFDQAFKKASFKDLIVVFGSFLTVSQIILKLNQKNSDIS